MIENMFSPHHSLPFGSRSSDDNLPNENNFQNENKFVLRRIYSMISIDNLSLLKLFFISSYFFILEFNEE